MRNYKIDILRGVSILLVLIHHFNIPINHTIPFSASQFGARA